MGTNLWVYGADRSRHSARCAWLAWRIRHHVLQRSPPELTLSESPLPNATAMPEVPLHARLMPIEISVRTLMIVRAST